MRLSLLCSANLLVLLVRYRRILRQRHYLTRLSIPPRTKSAWRILLSSGSERSMLNTTGFSTASFLHLHSLLLTKLSLPERSGMTVLDVLGLTLYYLNSTMKQKTLCQVFGQPPAVISRYLRRGIEALGRAIKEDSASRIAWPSAEEMKSFSARIEAREGRLKNVFGFVDGVYFPMNDPADPLDQNAYYNGWRSCCSVTNVLCFTPDGCICFARINCPGSWHDSAVAFPLYEVLLDENLTPPRIQSASRHSLSSTRSTIEQDPHN